MFSKSWVKFLKYWENRDVLGAHRPKTLSLFQLVLNCARTERLSDQFLSESSVFVVKKQLNDHNKPTMHLDTNLLIEILDLVCLNVLFGNKSMCLFCISTSLTSLP